MEDPLPAPSIESNSYRYSFMTGYKSHRMKRCIAVFVCLMLGLTVMVCPHIGFDAGKPGLWIIKLNSSINQAPRGGISGALAVLPQHIYFEKIPFPQIWEVNYSIAEVAFNSMKNWLVMVWFGSTYV